MTYRTIAQSGEFELVIKKSRFIAQLAHVTTEEDAQAFIARVKKTHYKATHNVPVYQLGDTDQVQRANDDGEPSGTAGVPMLQALQQMGLHDVVAVTTRYFGGTKLGAGGLIRAYANSVSEAVHHLGVVERQMRTVLTITIAYPQLGPLEHYLSTNDIAIAATDYGADLVVTLHVLEAELAALQAAITDLLSGAVSFTTGEPLAVFVPVPVD